MSLSPSTRYLSFYDEEIKVVTFGGIIFKPRSDKRNYYCSNKFGFKLIGYEPEL